MRTRARAAALPAGPPVCYALGSTTAPGPETIGSYDLLVNPATNASSTGIIATHIALVPGTSQALVWSRQLGPGTPAQPGMDRSVAALFDTETGTYVRACADGAWGAAGSNGGARGEGGRVAVGCPPLTLA